MQVQSDLSEQAAQLAELKALEHALLPAWLSRNIAKASVFANTQWYRLQESDLYGKAVALYGQAVEKATPYWERALTAMEPARVSSRIARGVSTHTGAHAPSHLVVNVAIAIALLWMLKISIQGFSCSQLLVDRHTSLFWCIQEFLAKLPLQDTINSAKQQVANIEHELHIIVKQLISSQPSLSTLNDPVTLQLIVYSIMGLPMVLLSLLLVSLVGGSGKKAKSSAGKEQKAAGRSAAARAALITGRPAGKGKKGKAIRDGSDVLYTA